MTEKRKMVRVGVDLVPEIERLAKERESNFNGIANQLMRDGLDPQPVDVTPRAIEKVLPALQSEELLRIAEMALTIVNTRGINLETIEGEQAIAAWTKLINGEKLTMPDMSRLAEATGTSLDEVRSALEKGEDEY